jgi:hypothetical protein
MIEMGGQNPADDDGELAAPLPLLLSLSPIKK